MKKNTIKIISDGISLEPESLSDAENIYRYMGCDAEISRFTGWNPYLTLEMTVEKIRKDIDDEASYSWIIKKDGDFIGTIGAYDYDPEEGSIEIGYSIARQYWGQGYAGASEKAVVNFLMNEPHIEKIKAWSHRDNIASIKVLRSAGFEEVCTDGEQITFERK